MASVRNGGRSVHNRRGPSRFDRRARPRPAQKEGSAARRTARAAEKAGPRRAPRPRSLGEETL